MKKLLVLGLLCLCISPSYAQKNFWRGVTHWKKPAAFETNIKSAVSRTEAALKLPVAPHIRITNMPGQPMVKLGGAVDNMPKVLSARMLTGAECDNAIRVGYTEWLSPLYLPLALNSEERAFYRGLHLNNLEAVKNILENGIELNEVSEETASETGPKIYFSGYPRRVVRFSTKDDDAHNLLPTIIRFELPSWYTVYEHKLLGGYKDYITRQNIPARYVMDAMVFLEVDGKPDWYKVTLENGELVFTPAPSRVFTEKELITHKVRRNEE